VTTRRVLVVDDDERLSRTLRTYLEMEGFEVLTSASAEEGLEVVAAERPDLVILDINMPGIDGVEACRRIKAHAPWLPVVLFSGRDRNDDGERALQAGASEFVTKPFSLEGLSQLIQTHLEGAARS
jgi:DNA-binding response OmpR family regulator